MEFPGHFEKLVNIIARLRAPDGCPWDRKQTHLSLRENLLLECYEALEALDEQDSKRFCEELGDLLLQIVLHAQIASEAGEFNISDVISGITEKLVRRHPHIFGSVKAGDAEEVAANWEALKQNEREEGVSVLEGVPKDMPALAYSKEVQSRAARVGFDWKDIEGVIDKLAEEVWEFQQAEDSEQKSQEFGDLLFTLVNAGRRMGLDPEAELRRSNRRFFRRFTYMEEICRRRGLKIGELSLEEQNALWEEAKRAEAAG